MYATETKKDKKISFQGTTQIELEITETTCFSLENQTNELEIKSLFNATFKFTELIIRNKQNNF